MSSFPARARIGVLFAGAALALGAAPQCVAAQAQGAPRPASVAAGAPRLWLVPSGDTVFVYLFNAPATARGFVVHRRAADAATAERELRTAEPVRPVRDPGLAAAMLGERRALVATAVRATDDAELLRRLQGDRFTGEVLALLDRDVARVLGRVHADTGVVPGESYEYAMTVLDAGGRPLGERLVGRVQVADGAIPAPTAVRAEPQDGGTRLQWSYPAYREGAGDHVVGFHVYRTGDGEPRRLTRMPVVRGTGPLRFADEEVEAGRSYRYEVRAVDVAGRLGPAGAPLEVRVEDRIAPAPPADLATAVSDGAVLVTWQLAPEADVAGYHVERAPGLDQPFVRLTRELVPARAPSYIDSTATGGEQHFYRVVAVDAADNASPPSNAIVAVPEDHTPPAPPSAVEATVQARRMSARWTASPSADVRGYYVYRGDATATAPVRLTDKPIEATAFADSGFAGGAGLNPGGRYRLRVTAVDASYNESAAVEVDVLVPDDEAPGAPTAFDARSIEGRHVLVAWNASPALDVREYVLTREELDAPGAAGRAAREIGRFGDPRLVEDTAVVLGRRYRYAILAVDSVGNRGAAAVDTVQFAEHVPPSPPRHAAARSATPRGIEVRWERVVDDALAGYHVYRATSPTSIGERVTTAPVRELVFVDRAGTAESWYHVRAVDALGNESRPSPAARVPAPRAR